MTSRAHLLAAVAAAALVVATPARADEPAGAGAGTDVATAHVARLAKLPAVKRDRALTKRRARHLLRRTLRADGFEAVSVGCARTGRAQSADCHVVSAQRGGAAWSGHGTVAVARDATRVTYALDSRAA